MDDAEPTAALRRNAMGEPGRFAKFPDMLDDLGLAARGVLAPQP